MIGEENTKTYILPIFLILLKDKNPHVRTNLIKNVGVLINIAGLHGL